MHGIVDETRRRRVNYRRDNGAGEQPGLLFTGSKIFVNFHFFL